MSLSVSTYNLKVGQAGKAEIECNWLNCEIPRRPWNVLIILTYTSSVKIVLLKKKVGGRDVCFHQDIGVCVYIYIYIYIYICVVLRLFGFTHAVKVTVVHVSRKQ